MAVEVNENNNSYLSKKNSNTSVLLDEHCFEITDAYVDIFCNTNKQEIQINIISIVNKYERFLFDVFVLIKILNEKSIQKIFKSNKIINVLNPKSQEEFNEIFIFNLNDGIIMLEDIEINIFISGKFKKTDESNKNINFSHFCVDGKNIVRKWIK